MSILEKNKLYLGDCNIVVNDFPDKSVDCIISDNPYGVDYTKETKNELYPTQINGDKVIDYRILSEYRRLLKNDGALYFFTNWRVYNKWFTALLNAGFKIKNCIVWVKDIAGQGHLSGQYAPLHEFIIFAVLSSDFKFKCFKRPVDVINEEKPKKNRLHLTEKPVKLMERLIIDSTNKGDLVLDCYAGSGTTAIACINSQRDYICIEIDKYYHKIAQDRINSHINSRLM